MKQVGIAGRAEALPPFIAMEVLERAQLAVVGLAN